MDRFNIALEDIDGGRVLDVATGQGGFVELLAHRLRSYSQIVGVDLSTRMMADAVKEVRCERSAFIQMDAGRLGFAEEAFDTVSVSASLHHMADAGPVLAEIMRALKPGGHMIVAEMHRDAATEAQMTSVLIHNWAAAVDEALGWPHYPTLTRQQILDLVGGLGLRDISVYEWADTDSDPHDEEAIEDIEGVFERYLPRARELPDYPDLQMKADTLRRRLGDVGAQSEPRIAIIGRKPG